MIKARVGLCGYVVVRWCGDVLMGFLMLGGEVKSQEEVRSYIYCTTSLVVPVRR